MKKILIVLCVLIVSKVAFAQDNPCTSPGNQINIRGFRLGMTEAEAKKRFPKIEFFKDLDVAGLSSWTSSSAGSSDDIFTEAEWENLGEIHLKFFDKKLSQIDVVYTGFTEWDSLAEFTDASAKSLKLPLFGSWQKLSEKAVKLSCKDFFIVSTLEPKVGQYELQKPGLFLSFSDYEQKIALRKANQNNDQRKFLSREYSKMPDNYEILPLPVNLFGEIEKGNEDIKPFVAVYFPSDLLAAMNWTRKTPLNLTIDGETLIISKRELEYEIEPEEEPFYI